MVSSYFGHVFLIPCFSCLFSHQTYAGTWKRTRRPKKKTDCSLAVPISRPKQLWQSKLIVGRRHTTVESNSLDVQVTVKTFGFSWYCFNPFNSQTMSKILDNSCIHSRAVAFVQSKQPLSPPVACSEWNAWMLLRFQFKHTSQCYRKTALQIIISDLVGFFVEFDGESSRSKF